MTGRSGPLSRVTEPARIAELHLDRFTEPARGVLRKAVSMAARGDKVWIVNKAGERIGEIVAPGDTAPPGPSDPA